MATNTNPSGQQYSTETKTQILPSGLNPEKFTSFKLKEVEQISHDTKLFRFALPENSSLQLPITSCILVRNPEQEGVKQTVRPYTPTSLENEVGHFDLIIKKYDTGLLTPILHNLKLGESFEFMGPFGKFPYKANTLSEVGLIAGGTGITPMLQLIRKILLNPEDKTKVNLLFANKTEKDILLKEELDSLAQRHSDRFVVTYILSSPSPQWTGLKGHVDRQLIESKLAKPTDLKSMVFVCGPAPMVNAMSGPKKSPQEQGELKGHLKDLGFTESQVFKF